jgi:hypothetical protein
MGNTLAPKGLSLTGSNLAVIVSKNPKKDSRLLLRNIGIEERDSYSDLT